VESQTCVTCGKHAPETETNYTLISAQFGWRLTRYKGADGSIVLEWRCPACWREYKRARTAPAGQQQGASGAPAASRSSWPPPPELAGSGPPAAAAATPASDTPGSNPPRASRRTSR
jgi:hypothetical protein